jgi:hypothetical protein
VSDVAVTILPGAGVVVYVTFVQTEGALVAVSRLNGRLFGGRTVTATIA